LLISVTAQCLRQGTGGLKAEKDKKNTPSPNPFFSQKISDSACNEP
jgi:hypothetical protein